MSYSYTTNSSDYMVQQPSMYGEPMQTKKNSSTGAAACAGALIGAAGGALAGYKVNPYVKKGVPTDTFTRRTFNELVKEMPENDQKTYSQIKEVMKKINNVSSAEDLKTLINNNPDAAKEIFGKVGQDTESFLNHINETNLNSTKNAIKDKLASSEKLSFQDLKNKMMHYWNAEKKIFENSENIVSEVFDAMQSAKKGLKLKQIAKFGAIGAALCGILGIIINKVVSLKKTVSQ